MADNVVIRDGQGEERTLATHESGGVHTPVNRISGPLLEAAETIADAVHAEDAAHADGDAGVQVLAVRRDADTSLVGATGDYAPLQVDANGRLKVAVLAGTQDDALTDAELRASAVPVSLATLPALPAGTNNIGDVDVLSLPALPAGTNNIGDVDVLSLPALPAGTNNIGDVDVLSLPALPAGTNNIGDVDVLSLPALPAGTNNIGDVDVLSLPALPAGSNNIGDVDVLSLPALPAGSNNIGDVDVLSLPALPAGTNVIGDVGLTGRTSGGLTLHRTISAATTNATSVKASAGQVFWVYATNTNASPRYLKLYNKASAPTVGTDTPVLTLLIPGNTVGAGFHLQSPLGLAFGTGIAFALTTGVADADATGVGANEIVVNLGFK